MNHETTKERKHETARARIPDLFTCEHFFVFSFFRVFVMEFALQGTQNMRYILCAAALVALAVASTPADETLKGIACRSVHLGYPAPEGVAFYNEMTVEKSADGTYF